MNKILVVNVNWIGDVVFSLPVFRALKEKYPSARISCLAVPRVREILECCPDIDDIIIYDDAGSHSSLFSKLGLIFRIHREKFDCAYLLHRSLTRALLVWFAGIPHRIGYATKGRGIFLTKAIIPVNSNSIHRSDYYLGVVEIKKSNRTCELSLPQIDQNALNQKLQSAGFDSNCKYLAIHVGGNWDLKRWPADSFRVLISRIKEVGIEKVVICGGEGDVELSRKIQKGVHALSINLVGELSLKELLHVFNRVDVVISADSGPLHLAGAIGTRTIGLFGPTRPEITAPRVRHSTVIIQKDVGCNRLACYHLSCLDNICMQAVTVEDVLNVIKSR